VSVIACPTARRIGCAFSCEEDIVWTLMFPLRDGIEMQSEKQKNHILK
jgi:hypothetical protein